MSKPPANKIQYPDKDSVRSVKRGYTPQRMGIYQCKTNHIHVHLKGLQIKQTGKQETINNVRLNMYWVYSVSSMYQIKHVLGL
jgi:hypothetical protein